MKNLKKFNENQVDTENLIGGMMGAAMGAMMGSGGAGMEVMGTTTSDVKTNTLPNVDPDCKRTTTSDRGYIAEKTTSGACSI